MNEDGFQKHKNNNLMATIHVDVNNKINKEICKKNFMDNLIKHPEFLEKFSYERLEVILQYYKDENDKKRRLLKHVFGE